MPRPPRSRLFLLFGLALTAAAGPVHPPAPLAATAPAAVGAKGPEVFTRGQGPATLTPQERAKAQALGIRVPDPAIASMTTPAPGTRSDRPVIRVAYRPLGASPWTSAKQREARP